MLRPMREALALEIGVEYNRILFTVSFACCAALLPVYWWLVSRTPRGRLPWLVYVPFVLVVVGLAFGLSEYPGNRRVAFGYFVLTPMSIQFLGSYRVGTANAVTNEINLDSFIGTVTSLSLWTGVVFQMPLIILFLTRIGLVGPEFLRTYRKHAFVAILILAAIITPPDVTSQILVSLPLFLLYEISIFLSARAQRRELRAEKVNNTPAKTR